MLFNGHYIIMDEPSVDHYEFCAISKIWCMLKDIKRNTSPGIVTAIDKFFRVGNCTKLSIQKIPVICHNYAAMRKMQSSGPIYPHLFEIIIDFAYLTKRLARIIVYSHKSLSPKNRSFLVQNNMQLVRTRDDFLKEISIMEERNNSLWNGVCVSDSDGDIMVINLVNDPPYARMANSPSKNSFPALFRVERFQYKLGYREDSQNPELGSHYVYYLFTKNCAKALLYGTRDAKRKPRRLNHGRRRKND